MNGQQRTLPAFVRALTAACYPLAMSLAAGRALVVCLAVLVLSACGGGGPSGPTPPTTAPVARSPVTVVVFYQPQTPDERPDPLYPLITNLLKEYAHDKS